jgi:ABC-type antimicrobial peptide transport system permease subunit
MEFSLLPLSDLHFYQNFDRPAANKPMLFGLMVIGGIMLLLAGMNFINLETAQSVLRAKEVGIRKTMGSNRRQLVLQSIVETGLLVIIAISFGIVGSELLVIYFHEFLPSGLDIQYGSWQGLVFFASIFLFLTILSGIFPALLLAAYSPTKTLSKDLRIPQGFSFGYLIQRYLTVFQFACAIMFVVGVLVVSDQVHYLTKRELGFETERILFARLPFSQVTPEAKRSLQLTIEQQAFVQQTSYASDMLASSGLWTSVIEVPTEEGKEELSVQVKAIDEDFMDLFGVPIIQGINLNAESNQLLVNETLHNQLSNLQKGSLIGETVGYRDEIYTIVGIVPDVHTRTLREPILPMIYHYGSINSNTLNVKVKQGQEISSAKQELDQLFSTHFPLETAGFKLFEHELAAFYEWDLKLGKILTMASLMAILISLLGLFALTSFTIAKKSKEISIRKVLGASVPQLLLGIAKSYMLLILMAVILGSIPAWLLADRWLADFAFRIPMPIHLFVYAGLLLALLALLIVSVHGIKVASRNPSEVLKGE